MILISGLLTHKVSSSCNHIAESNSKYAADVCLHAAEDISFKLICDPDTNDGTLYSFSNEQCDGPNTTVVDPSLTYDCSLGACTPQDYVWVESYFDTTSCTNKNQENRENKMAQIFEDETEQCKDGATEKYTCSDSGVFEWKFCSNDSVVPDMESRVCNPDSGNMFAYCDTVTVTPSKVCDVRSIRFKKTNKKGIHGRIKINYKKSTVRSKLFTSKEKLVKVLEANNCKYSSSTQSYDLSVLGFHQNDGGNSSLLQITYNATSAAETTFDIDAMTQSLTQDVILQCVADGNMVDLMEGTMIEKRCK